MPVLSYAEFVQFDQAAHVYTVAGVQRPSVTQILKEAGLIDTTWYTDEARERGRAVHLATQFLDEDDLDWATVLAQYRGYVAAWERFKQESHFSISHDSEGKLLIEYLLFQPISGYCGMLDRVGTIGTTEYLIDIKTGDPQDWHGYQLAAYSQCLPNPHSRKRMTVHLRANGSYSTREHALTAFAYDWQVFAAAAVVWHAKPSALQIIRRVAERESALEISDEEETARAPEAAEDDLASDDARSTFKQRTSALQEQIQALPFTNVEDLSKANELLASVLSLKDAIERYHEPIKGPLKEAHAAACKAEHDDLDPVVALEKKLKQGIAALDVKLRQLETEAARVRQQAAAEAGSAMQQQMIEAARQSGASEEVLASLGAMEILVPVVETESFARPKGYSTRDQFEIEVTDILLLARAVVAGSIQKEVLQANTKLLAAMAKASNGDIRIPGVRITKKVNVTGRRVK